MMIKKSKNHKTGFTLIETLVAISILSLAFAGILSLSSIAIRSSAAAANQNKASFLAGEGIEYIRNKRDSNLISGVGWFSGLGSCEQGCFVEIFDSGHSITPCSGGGCPKLKFNETFNRYDYDAGGAETIFIRELTITRLSSDEAILSSEISWTQGGEIRNFSLEESLFDLPL